jgi:DNA-binding transcriptional MocR family regulator
VWGFRIGFITYGAKGLAEEHYEALIQKTIGAVRATISSASKIGQSLLLKVMQGEGYLEECERVAHAMKVRYKIVKEAIAQEEGPLQPLPFNSGYFCAFKTQGEANTLREVLLKEGQIGSVALGGDLLRIAYSSVDCEQLAPLIEEIYRRSRELWR